LTQNRIFNRCTGFIFAQGKLTAPIRTELLLSGFTRNSSTTGITSYRRITPKILLAGMAGSLYI
jgi:hypothetical protein